MDLRANWAASFIKLADAVQVPDICAPGMTGIELLPAIYPGVSVDEPYPDWRSYQYLELTLYSSSPEPFELTLRIHDRLHDQSHTDRYNRTLAIRPGTNRFRIPLTEVSNGPIERPLKLGDIAGVMLFALDPPQPRRICIGNMRLDK